MPNVPEPLSAPKSLGGLDIEIKGEVPLEDSSMSALSERAGELKEDIDKLQELREAIKESDEEDSEVNSIDPIEHSEEA